MYKIVIIATCGLVMSCAREQACESDPVFEDTLANSSLDYDSLYAEKLGADEYGMHQYVLALLKSGPNRDQSVEEAEALQAAHLENIGRLADEGTLVLAGPFMDEGDLRGIYIFDVTSIEEAEELTKTDPAIQRGRLVMELHPWYGSAAVMEINEIHERIAKINF